MNKTIKKIVALSMGATMLAGTAAMALATTLADYPAPFVKDGAYMGKIVIGETAKSIDTVGAMDIAASLQRASAVAVASSGSSPTASTADGYLFSGSKVLVLGANLSSTGKNTIDNSVLPTLLESGTLTSDGGTDYDYDVKLQLTASGGKVAADATSDIQDLGYDKPLVYFDFNKAEAYTTFVDFQKSWAAETFVNSETITLFGKDYTFDPNNKNTDDILTLFGTGTSLFVSKGTPQKVTYNEKEYTIEVLGGNTADSTANIRINGEVLTVKKGDSKTLPARTGLPFYVKQVFVDDSIASGADISVQLFVGSDKLELDQAAGTVTKNGVELSEVALTTVGNTSGWYGITGLKFTVTPSDADVEQLFILPGESYTDPVFGAFKLDFVGQKDMTANKEMLVFSKSGSTASIEFTPRDAVKSTKLTVLDDNAVQSDVWTSPLLGNLTKDKIFFWNDNADVTKAKTHVLQVTSVKDGNNTASDNYKIEVKDLTYGKTYTITDATNPLSSDIALYAVAGSFGGTSGDKYFNLSTAVGGAPATSEFVLYTKASTNVTFDSTFVNYKIAEDTDGNADTTKTKLSTNASVNYTWSATDKYQVALTPNNVNMMSLTDNVDNNNYWGTPFGTYVDADVDKNSYVKFYTPDKEVSYDMFLLPVDSKVTISGGAASGGAVSLNPISVGMAILDSDATLGGTTPYIVVGGPCANTVAATLMGNKANCAEGFVEGKAVIKLFADKNALLVAGYTGKDTQGACRVLASYKDYAAKFTGTELEVSTANLAQLSVSNVQ